METAATSQFEDHHRLAQIRDRIHSYESIGLINALIFLIMDVPFTTARRYLDILALVTAGLNWVLLLQPSIYSCPSSGLNKPICNGCFSNISCDTALLKRNTHFIPEGEIRRGAAFGNPTNGINRRPPLLHLYIICTSEQVIRWVHRATFTKEN